MNNQFGMRVNPSKASERKGPLYCPTCKADTMGATLCGKGFTYRRCTQCGFEKHFGQKAVIK